MPMGTGTYGSQKGRPPKKEREKKNMGSKPRSMYYGGSEVARPN